MKNLTNTLQTSFIALLVGSTLTIYMGSYLFVKSLLVKNGIDIEELNLLYKTLGIFLFIILAFSIYLYNRTLNNISSDMKEIQIYLNEISENKNYSATIKIKNYSEFLNISLVLKNIAKRLNQKEKKTSKK